MIDPATMPGSPDRPISIEGFAGLSWVAHSERELLIALLPDRGLFLELGSASGVTAALVADARPELRIVCLDTFLDCDRPHVPEGDRDRLAHWARNRRPNMTLWLGTLVALAAACPTLRADAILVDASHEENDVAADLALAARLLAPAGTLFLHDYDEPAWPGVRLAADRFCAAAGFGHVGQNWTMVALRRG